MSRKPRKKSNFSMVIDLLESVDDQTASTWIDNYTWWDQQHGNSDEKAPAAVFFAEASTRLVEIALRINSHSMFISGGKTLDGGWGRSMCGLIDSGRIDQAAKLAEVLMAHAKNASHREEPRKLIARSIASLDERDLLKIGALLESGSEPTPFANYISRIYKGPQNQNLFYSYMTEAKENKVDLLLRVFPECFTSEAVSRAIESSSSNSIWPIVRRVAEGHPLIDDPLGTKTYDVIYDEDEFRDYDDDEFGNYEEHSYTPEHEKDLTSASLGIVGLYSIKYRLYSMKPKDFNETASQIIQWIKRPGWQPPTMSARVEMLSQCSKKWTPDFANALDTYHPVPSAYEIAQLAEGATDVVFQKRFKALVNNKPAADVLLSAATIALEHNGPLKTSHKNRILQIFVSAPEKNRNTHKKSLLKTAKAFGQDAAEWTTLLDHAALSQKTPKAQGKMRQRRL